MNKCMKILVGSEKLTMYHLTILGGTVKEHLLQNRKSDKCLKILTQELLNLVDKIWSMQYLKDIMSDISMNHNMRVNV